MNELRLSAPSEVRRILGSYGVQLKRRWGQNFLIDANILRHIVDAASLGADDTVIEIGPGIGSLTQALAQRAGRVIAIEIDRELVHILRELFADEPKVELIAGDALKVDFSELVPEGTPIKVVANLPYYITSPLIFHLLEQRVALEFAVLMVQAEVADRLVAAPGSKDYGSLSVAVQYRADVDVVVRVPRTVFMPQPQVDSKVVRLRPRPYTPAAKSDELFFAVVRAAFAQRRKTLRKALQPLAQTYQIDSTELLERAGIDPSLRGEKLDLGTFVSLANVLYDMIE